MPAFWFHYNRPLSLKVKKPMLTVHYKGACHFVRSIQCNVPITSRERTAQPRLVMAGTGEICFHGNIATINPPKSKEISRD